MKNKDLAYQRRILFEASFDNYSLLQRYVQNCFLSYGPKC
jgi:hypothetical protein